MSHETSIQYNHANRRHLTVALAAAAVAYSLVLVSVFVTALAGVTVRGLGMIALAVAIAFYVKARLADAPISARIGARTQQIQRRYRTLVGISAGLLYLVLVGGGFVTDSRAVMSCLTLPACQPSNWLALAAMAHRGSAAGATVLIALVVWQTWRVRPERAIRFAAASLLGLMLLGNAVGVGQVLMVRLHGFDDALLMRIIHVVIGAAAWSSIVVLATLAQRPPFAGLASSPRAAQWSSRIADYVSLTKPRVISLLIFTTLLTMFITPAGIPGAGLILWTMLGGWLMPAGAHALNCYFDRDIDAKMGRTGRRPLPSNRIPAWHALVLGTTLSVISFAILAVFVNMLTALLALAGLFYYVVIYTLWLKRLSPSNIVIGGGAGAFPPLIGWAAASGSLAITPLLLFAVIFMWTPPHFWALALIREKDYANAGVPMLPVVAGPTETRRQIVLYSVLMVGLTLVLTPLSIMGLPYLALALALGGTFIAYALRLQRTGTTADAWRLYRYSLLYLALLFCAMVVDRVMA